MVTIGTDALAGQPRARREQERGLSIRVRQVLVHSIVAYYLKHLGQTITAAGAFSRCFFAKFTD